MSEPIWRNAIIVKKTSTFFRTKAFSGYRLQIEDPDATEYLLRPDASDEELGQTVLDSLQESRFLPHEEAVELQAKAKLGREEQIRQLIERYGYKTKRSLYKNMKCCFVHCYENVIEIRPTNHETSEGWGLTGIEKSDYVKIPADSSPPEVGTAIRLAFTAVLVKQLTRPESR